MTKSFSRISVSVEYFIPYSVQLLSKSKRQNKMMNLLLDVSQCGEMTKFYLYPCTFCNFDVNYYYIGCCPLLLCMVFLILILAPVLISSGTSKYSTILVRAFYNFEKVIKVRGNLHPTSRPPALDADIKLTLEFPKGERNNFIKYEKKSLLFHFHRI